MKYIYTKDELLSIGRREFNVPADMNPDVPSKLISKLCLAPVLLSPFDMDKSNADWQDYIQAKDKRRKERASAPIAVNSKPKPNQQQPRRFVPPSQRGKPAPDSWEQRKQAGTSWRSKDTSVTKTTPASISPPNAGRWGWGDNGVAHTQNTPKTSSVERMGLEQMSEAAAKFQLEMSSQRRPVQAPVEDFFSSGIPTSSNPLLNESLEEGNAPAEDLQYRSGEFGGDYFASTQQRGNNVAASRLASSMTGMSLMSNPTATLGKFAFHSWILTIHCCT